MGSLSTLGTSIERARPGVRTGVAEITVHAARRTCASLLVAMDVHPRVAMQILRHSQIAVTMNVYSEVSTEDTREALRLLGERLGGEAS
jgi:integrase